MWPLLVFALALVIFAFIIVGSFRAKTEEVVEDIDIFLDLREDELEDIDANKLDAAIEDTVEHLEDPALRSFNPRTRREAKERLKESYQSLWETFAGIYRRYYDSEADTQALLEALRDKSTGAFEAGDTVHVPSIDLYGEITSVNEDGTYTVCNVIGDCARVYEHDMERLADDEGE